MALVIENTVTASNANDLTVNVAAGLSNVVILAIGCPYDSDDAHTNLDTAFTFGGTTMTQVQNQHTASQAPGAQIYILKNYTSNGNKTMDWTGYHTSPSGFGGCVYVISGADVTTNPDANGGGKNSSSANPSYSLTTVTANCIIFEGVSCSQSLTPADSQTADVSNVSSNGGRITIAHMTANTVQTYTQDYTASSGTWAFAGCAIRPAAVTFIAPSPLEVLQAVNRSYRY